MICGAGPGGSSCAIALARLGISSLLVGEISDGGLRPGEIVPPLCEFLLDRLRVKDILLGSHLEANSMFAAWRTNSPECIGIGMHPHGRWWHLDRAAFDRSLFEAAARLPHVESRSARVTGASFSSASDAWTVTTRAGLSTHVFQARYLVDATGRNGNLGRSLSRRVRIDRLVALVRWFDEVDTFFPLLLEARPEGWWYSASLPGRRTVATFVTDAGALKGQGRSLSEFWSKNLRQSESSSERVHGWIKCQKPESIERNIQAFDAGSSYLERQSGLKWISIGDSAAALDPISSHGISGAIHSSIEAASALNLALAGNSESIAEYRVKATEQLLAYAKGVYVQYAARDEWRGLDFWEQRRAAALRLLLNVRRARDKNWSILNLPLVGV